MVLRCSRCQKIIMAETVTLPMMYMLCNDHESHTMTEQERLELEMLVQKIFDLNGDKLKASVVIPKFMEITPDETDGGTYGFESKYHKLDFT